MSEPETIIEIIARDFIEEVELNHLEDDGDAQDIIIWQALEDHELPDSCYDEVVKEVGKQLEERKK